MYNKLEFDKKECRQCKKRFTPKQHNQAFCRNSCRVRWWRNRRYIITCIICGEEKEVTAKHSKMCYSCSRNEDSKRIPINYSRPMLKTALYMTIADYELRGVPLKEIGETYARKPSFLQEKYDELKKLGRYDILVQWLKCNRW